LREGHVGAGYSLESRMDGLMVNKGGSAKEIIRFLHERAGWVTDLIQGQLGNKILKVYTPQTRSFA
jgi:hypothetical protein